MCFFLQSLFPFPWLFTIRISLGSKILSTRTIFSLLMWINRIKGPSPPLDDMVPSPQRVVHLVDDVDEVTAPMELFFGTVQSDMLNREGGMAFVSRYIARSYRFIYIDLDT